MIDREHKWRLPVYWRIYPGHAVSILFAPVGTFLLVTWATSAWDLHEDWLHNARNYAEPVLVFVGAILAIVTGTKFSGNLRALRSRLPSEPLEVSEDKSVDPWRAVNHSFSGIEWSPEIAPRLLQAVRAFCAEQYRGANILFHLAGYIPEQLREETGTINFRLLKFIGRPRFIRIYKKPIESDLYCRKVTLNHLRSRGVFDERVCRALVPEKLRQSGERSKTREIVFRPPGDFVDCRVGIQVFRHLAFAAHFSGEGEQEILSVASRLGELHDALQSMNPDDAQKIARCQRDRETGGKECDAATVLDRWRTICAVLPRDSRAEPFIPGLGSSSGALVRKLGARIETIAQLREQYQTSAHYLLLHDVHPHNVVFDFDARSRRRECVLIYDYSWIGYWHHAVIVAFAIHRFVREFVRRKAAESESDEDRFAAIRIGTREFLHAYTRWCKLPIPERFLQDIAGYIGCGNVDKLLGTLEKYLEIKPDNLFRTPQRLAGEVRKFVRFTEEAEQFSVALRGAPPVYRFIALKRRELEAWKGICERSQAPWVSA